MFKEAFQLCYEKVLEHSRIGIDENAPAIDCLKRRLKNLVLFHGKFPYNVPFVAKYMQRIGAKQSEHFSQNNELIGDIAKFVKKGIKNKEIIDLPENVLAHMIINCDYYGIMENFRRHPEYYENEPLIDKIIETFYKALLP